MSEPLTVTVIVPFFNEGEKVAATIRQLLGVAVINQVIAVDDGSTDDPGATLAQITDPRLIALRHPANHGKGAAIRTGLEAATCDVIVIQDADGEYDPGGIPQLVEALSDRNADACYGNRFVNDQSKRMTRRQALANRVLTWLTNRVYGLSISDVETGHKALRRKNLSQMNLLEDRFGFEIEVTAKLARQGARVVEIPIAYTPRARPEEKKIGVVDFVRALWCVWRYVRSS